VQDREGRARAPKAVTRSLTSNTPWRPTSNGHALSGACVAPGQRVRPDRLRDSSSTSVQSRVTEGWSVALSRERRGWRTDTSSLGGEQSPWKYRVCGSGNGAARYGLGSGARPWSRSGATARGCARTAGGQGPRRRGAAAGEGDASKGTNRVAGNGGRRSSGWSVGLRNHEAGARGRASGNAANPFRTELQHARNPRAEQVAEVVRIHEGGTGCAAGGAGAPKGGGDTDRE
jgi:hypothetical protein